MDWTRVDLDKMLALKDGELITLMNDVIVAMQEVMGPPSETASKAIARYNEHYQAGTELTGNEKWIITRWCLRSNDLAAAYRLEKLKDPQ